MSDFESVKKLTGVGAADKFWLEVGEIRKQLKQPLFSNVARLSKTVLSKPHSTATAERKFSQQNVIKNNMRNNLTMQTTSSLMQAKDAQKYGGGVSNNCVDNPSKELLKNKVVYKTTVGETVDLENTELILITEFDNFIVI